MWMLVLVTVLETGVPKAIELDNFETQKSCHIAEQKFSKEFSADNQSLVCVFGQEGKKPLKPGFKHLKEKPFWQGIY